METWRN